MPATTLPILGPVRRTEHSNRGAKRAREARGDLRVLSGPLDDIVRVVEDSGLAWVVVCGLEEGIAGVFLDCPGRDLILINGADSPARQRFTVAHELGHLRMGHGTVVDQPSAFTGYQHDPIEVSANAFAAEFLMPRLDVAAWGDDVLRLTLDHVVTCAAHYGVSAPAARYALAGAGVEDDGERLRRIDDEIAAEAHFERSEALGLSAVVDVLSQRELPRIPRGLQGSAIGDLLAGLIDARGLADRLGQPAEDVEAMLASVGLG